LRLLLELVKKCLGRECGQDFWVNARKPASYRCRLSLFTIVGC
jgi:hypothetical protein